MERNPAPVSLPVLWSSTCPICFHKTPKDPHDLFKKDRDMHSNLFGRHVDYWQNKGRDYSSTRYSHSFTSVPMICYKSEKWVMTPVQEIEFLGLIVSSKEMAICLGYLTKINETNMSGYVLESRNNSFRVIKGVINIFGHSPNKNSFVVFSNSSKFRHWRKMALTQVKCYWTKNLNWSFFGGWKTSKYIMEGS